MIFSRARLALTLLTHGVSLLAGWVLWGPLPGIEQGGLSEAPRTGKVSQRLKQGSGGSGPAPVVVTADLPMVETDGGGDGRKKPEGAEAGALAARLARRAEIIQAVEISSAYPGRPGLTEEQIALLKGRGLEEAAQEVAREDVGAEMEQHIDWRYLFGRGEATAQEVMAALAQASPELAAAQPELLRAAAFRELVLEDPRRALDFFGNGKTPEQRQEMVFSALYEVAQRTSPAKVLAVLQQMPESEGGGAGRERRLVWENLSYGYFQILGEGYVGWLEALPPGVDRDLAIAAVGFSVSTDEERRNLLKQITDPEVRAQTEAAR